MRGKKLRVKSRVKILKGAASRLFFLFIMIWFYLCQGFSLCTIQQASARRFL